MSFALNDINDILFKCAECDKCFSRKGNLVIHMRLHTGEKPYKCSFCRKCFIQKVHLLDHMRVHTRQKPFQCTYCHKCFARRSTVTQHSMNCHDNNTSYHCSHCKNVFSEENLLLWHMTIHCVGQFYQCPDCSKSFTSKLFYFIHVIIVHMRHKPYRCLECEQTFPNKDKLCFHIKVHTKHRVLSNSCSSQKEKNIHQEDTTFPEVEPIYCTGEGQASVTCDGIDMDISELDNPIMTDVKSEVSEYY